jgi:hypothetical protein
MKLYFFFFPPRKNTSDIPGILVLIIRICLYVRVHYLVHFSSHERTVHDFVVIFAKKSWICADKILKIPSENVRLLA